MTHQPPQPAPERESDKLSAERKPAPNAPENFSLSTSSSVTGSVVTPGDTISEPDQKTPLLCGVDTLDLGIQAIWNEADWKDLSSRLAQGKTAAGNTNGIRFDEESLILPKGRQGYAWHLQSPDLNLYIADRRFPHAETPNLYVSPQCRLIWERGLLATAEFVTRKIQERASGNSG